MQLYNIFCSCLKPSTKKTENLRTRRKTSKQQHHQKRGECNSLTTALQQTIAARETCSGQNLPPDGPAAANCRQRDLQRPLQPAQMVAEARPTPPSLTSISPSSSALTLQPIDPPPNLSSPLPTIPVHPNHHDLYPCYHHPTHPHHDHLLYSTTAPPILQE